MMSMYICLVNHRIIIKFSIFDFTNKNYVYKGTYDSIPDIN